MIPRLLLSSVGPLLIAGALSACMPDALIQAPAFRASAADDTSAIVLGRVLAPAVLLAPDASALDPQGALAELPLSAATIDLVDEAGQPLTSVPATASDANGGFKLLNVPRGASHFVRVRFSDTTGAERRLYAYVRPDGAAACVELSLPSTFVAEALIEEPELLPLVKLPKLLPITAEWRKQLPGALVNVPAASQQALLAALASSATPGVGESEAITIAAAGGSGGLINVSAQAVVAQLQAAVPPVNTAVDASVEIEYEVQQLGRNAALFAGQEQGHHVMAGRCELVLKASANAAREVSFFLNNTRLAQATFSDGAWRTHIDTRGHADGAYVLSALVQVPDAPHPEIRKAFVYVRNAEALAELDCDAYDAAQVVEALNPR